jgi:hypothetical protein
MEGISRSFYYIIISISFKMTMKLQIYLLVLLVCDSMQDLPYFDYSTMQPFRGKIKLDHESNVTLMNANRPQIKRQIQGWREWKDDIESGLATVEPNASVEFRYDIYGFYNHSIEIWKSENNISTVYRSDIVRMLGSYAFEDEIFTPNLQKYYLDPGSSSWSMKFNQTWYDSSSVWYFTLQGLVMDIFILYGLQPDGYDVTKVGERVDPLVASMDFYYMLFEDDDIDSVIKKFARREVDPPILETIIQTTPLPQIIKTTPLPQIIQTTPLPGNNDSLDVTLWVAIIVGPLLFVGFLIMGVYYYTRQAPAGALGSQQGGKDQNSLFQLISYRAI